MLGKAVSREARNSGQEFSHFHVSLPTTLFQELGTLREVLPQALELDSTEMNVIHAPRLGHRGCQTEGELLTTGGLHNQNTHGKAGAALLKNAEELKEENTHFHNPTL